MTGGTDSTSWFNGLLTQSNAYKTIGSRIFSSFTECEQPYLLTYVNNGHLGPIVGVGVSIRGPDGEDYYHPCTSRPAINDTVWHRAPVADFDHSWLLQQRRATDCRQTLLPVPSSVRFWSKSIDVAESDWRKISQDLGGPTEGWDVVSTQSLGRSIIPMFDNRTMTTALWTKLWSWYLLALIEEEGGLAGVGAYNAPGANSIIINRDLPNIAVPPLPVAPVAAGGVAYGLDARIIDYITRGGLLNGGNAVLPPGWPDAQVGRQTIAADTLFVVDDPEYLLTEDELQYLAMVMGSDGLPYVAVNAAFAALAPAAGLAGRVGNRCIPALFEQRVWGFMVLLRRSAPVFAAPAARLGAAGVLTLIGKLESIRADAVASKCGLVIALGTCFAERVVARGMVANAAAGAQMDWGMTDGTYVLADGCQAFVATTIHDDYCLLVGGSLEKLPFQALDASSWMSQVRVGTPTATVLQMHYLATAAANQAFTLFGPVRLADPGIQGSLAQALRGYYVQVAWGNDSQLPRQFGAATVYKSAIQVVILDTLKEINEAAATALILHDLDLAHSWTNVAGAACHWWQGFPAALDFRATLDYGRMGCLIQKFRDAINDTCNAPATLDEVIAFATDVHWQFGQRYPICEPVALRRVTNGNHTKIEVMLDDMHLAVAQLKRFRGLFAIALGVVIVAANVPPLPAALATPYGVTTRATLEEGVILHPLAAAAAAHPIGTHVIPIYDQWGVIRRHTVPVIDLVNDVLVGTYIPAAHVNAAALRNNINNIQVGSRRLRLVVEDRVGDPSLVCGAAMDINVFGRWAQPATIATPAKADPVGVPSPVPALIDENQ